MRASSSRQGICSLLPDTYYLLRVVTALCCESDALSQARPGQEPGVSLLLAVVRTTNEPPWTAAKNTLYGGGISTLQYGTCGFGPHTRVCPLLASRPPCAPQRHPAGTHLLQSIRRESCP